MWFYNLIRLCGFIEEFSEVKIVSVIGGWVRVYSKVRGGVEVVYLIVFILRKINEFYSEEIFY